MITPYKTSRRVSQYLNIRLGYYYNHNFPIRPKDLSALLLPSSLIDTEFLSLSKKKRWIRSIYREIPEIALNYRITKGIKLCDKSKCPEQFTDEVFKFIGSQLLENAFKRLQWTNKEWVVLTNESINRLQRLLTLGV